ncbi:uncharacterized protein LOC122311401 isoform X1 [Carya illinoinensis]|uniref:Uncharacterized protein n=2 Tax=Carya illinoinensis TaxID=32201 RepID=A0A922FXK0_CARIL|nr:uncharacterized protein LOC122311401 isoform X1 [Carya illinoinensis]KAG6730336.1 hypothetical protein I3842_01G074600 [Carya illinoinensis]
MPSSSPAIDNRPLRRSTSCLSPIRLSVAASLAISHVFYYFQYKVHKITFTSQDQHCTEGEMAVMQKLRMFVVQEPVVAASCLIAGVGLFLPAVVRPILDSFEASKQVPPPALSDVVAGMTGKK